MPDKIPNNGMLLKSLSRTPVISTHPKIARTMQITFLDVIFSLKSTYAKIKT